MPIASDSGPIQSRLKLRLAAAGIATQTITVSSLAEARAKVAAFIRGHDLCAGQYDDTCGRLDRGGKPYARVSYHGRLWALDEQGRETYRAMNDLGGSQDRADRSRYSTDWESGYSKP